MLSDESSLGPVVDRLVMQFGSGRGLAEAMGAAQSQATDESGAMRRERLLRFLQPTELKDEDPDGSDIAAHDLVGLDELQQGLLVAAVELRAEELRSGQA
jgi:hypothetical protein